jgi:hypothetical protein
MERRLSINYDLTLLDYPPTNPHWAAWWVMARSPYVYSIRKACAPAVATLMA